MTREEAITVFKAFMGNPLFSDVHKAAFNIAIHDIKQRHDWDINNLVLINKDNYEPLEQEPRKGKWIRMSDLSEQDDYRYKCSCCGNVIYYKNKMDLYTFNSWCGRCGSDNGVYIKEVSE